MTSIFDFITLSLFMGICGFVAVGYTVHAMNTLKNAATIQWQHILFLFLPAFLLGAWSVGIFLIGRYL